MTHKPKQINDPVHGLITLDGRLFQLIDTPEYQRLRDIKQLGGACYVFPGTSHSRFEHGIGTAHVSTKWFDHLIKTTPHFFNPTYRFYVQVAGLCHDLGHGPFSHLFEKFLNQLSPELKKEWHHENMSCIILKQIVSNNPQINLDSDALKIINAMILGEKLPNLPSFLFQIVHNKTFEIDADKFDYLQRDCKSAGLPIGVDCNRIIEMSRLTTEGQIEFPLKESYLIVQLFAFRYSMYKQVYYHPVSGAIELMIKDILMENDFNFNKLKEGINPDTLDWYLKLTDSVLNEVERKNPSSLLMMRLRYRNLYKLSNHFIIKQEASEEEIDYMVKKFETKETHVVYIKRNWCKGKSNPLENVTFFPNPANLLAVDSLMPAHYQERVVRVYAKDSSRVKEIASVINDSVDDKMSAIIGAIGQTKQFI